MVDQFLVSRIPTTMRLAMQLCFPQTRRHLSFLQEQGFLVSRTPSLRDLLSDCVRVTRSVSEFDQGGAEVVRIGTFAQVGYPDTAYERMMRIIDDAAGQLRGFQVHCSRVFVKPGACKCNLNSTSAELLALNLWSPCFQSPSSGLDADFAGRIVESSSVRQRLRI